MKQPPHQHLLQQNQVYINQFVFKLIYTQEILKELHNLKVNITTR